MTVVLLGPGSDAGLVALEGGGKAAHLHRLATLGVRVPAWCCVPAAAFDAFLAALEGDAPDAIAAEATGATEATAAAAEIETRFARAPLPGELRCAIRAELERLGLADADLAVRSSGIGEDSAEHSFAGQFSSFLFQRGEAQLLDALRRCWASAYSARNLAYRRVSGLDGRPIRMGVIVQRMVNAECAGVAFSRTPLRATDRATLIVDGVVGQGEGLVNGALDADHFEVDRETLAVRASIAVKSHAVVRDPAGGTRTVALDPERTTRPSLTDGQVREVAGLALRLERALGRPQDVEWAYEAGTLHCLQTRPITTLPPDAVFDARVAGAEPVIWDNSNIVESFAGVTTPLTFTHVNRCYREVYLQFCRIMGVPERTIAEHEPLFRNMLGLVRGRIYYNLVNWYRLLGLFPGVAHNRAFMETMMGVQQSLTPELSTLFDDLRHPPRVPLRRRGALVASTTYHLTRTRRHIDDFMRRIERIYTPLETADLRAYSLAEQIALYRRLETEVLQHWTAPIVNDTRCMVAFGVLGALTRRWVTPGDAAADSLRNDLLCGEGDLKSTEPTKLLMRIAQRVDGGDAAAREWFTTQPAAEVWTALQDGADPAIRTLFEDFLRRYGFRCVNELKLEESDLHDDPRFVVSSVQSYLRTGSHSIAAMDAREAGIREAAEARVRAAVRGLRRWLYFRALTWARRAVSDRELLRFERTRTFGITRRLFRGIGANLAALGVIEREDDVFYLTLDELMAYQEGRSVTGDFRPVVAARRAEFDEYRAGPPLPDRFLTRGAVGSVMRYPGVLRESDLLASAAAGDEPGLLRGTPCSPGVVEGVVRVVERVEDAAGIDGEILVTERTDPGWVPIFPACAGLIIERGSLLSHSAVVARELGIPTIVGVRGRPMQTLRSGDRVRMDGGSGEIRIL